MKTAASILFAFRMLIPKHKTPSNARKSMAGAVICVALSLIPLVVVLVVADGMIEGITDRIVGLSSYHIQIEHRNNSIQANSPIDELKDISKQIRELSGVLSASAEIQAGAAVSVQGATVTVEGGIISLV